MYGYFDSDKAYLRNNESNIFKSYYCRLCYCLWNKGGVSARYLTTYDATVFNLVVAIAGADERPPLFPCERVKTHNKKYFKEDKVGNIIADLSMYGVAIKIKDNEADGDKAKAFWANFFVGKALKKAINNNKEDYEKAVEDIRRMDTLQQNNAPIEEVLEAYGLSVENGFRRAFNLEEKYLYCIKRIARWVLLIDMFDDYNKDFPRKSPNSLRKEECPTIDKLFEKYHWEIIPLVRKEIDELKNALLDIRNDMTEWVVLNKIIRHSMATLIPDILNGKDVSYHYFKSTCLKNVRSIQHKRIVKKYEKDTTNNKSN